MSLLKPALYSTANTDAAVQAGTNASALTFDKGGSNYVLNCLTSIEQMWLISNEWKHLERLASQQFIYFQSFDWCYNWCNSFANNEDRKKNLEIKIYTLRKNDELILIWPMMIVNSGSGIKSLTFLTEPLGQYSNIIFNPDQLTLEIGEKVWEFIKGNNSVDVINLDMYPASSLLKQILQNKGFIEKSKKYSSSLNMKIIGTWEEYTASLSKKRRKQRRQNRNKLVNSGELEYETFYGGEEDYCNFVALALKWKVDWLYKTGRRETALSNQKTTELLSILKGTPATDQSPPDGAVLGVLKFNGAPIAIEIGMCLNSRYYSYIGAFDWESRNMSPGKVQMENTQMWAKDAGILSFDYLGDPADYKAAWTNTTDELESKTFPLTMRGLFYSIFWKAYVRPLARKIFNKMDSQKRSKLLTLLGIRRSDKSTSGKGNSKLAS